MERLTERTSDELGGIYVKDHDYITASHKLADYEDAEENGLLVRLPCKVGDIVHVIYCGYVTSAKILAVYIDSTGSMFDLKIKTNKENSMCSDDFNKFLFRFKVNATANFLESGGLNIMNTVQQKEWLKSENHEFLFQLMRNQEDEDDEQM